MNTSRLNMSNMSFANRSLNQSMVKPITLTGSANIVVDFLKYAVNSILYQRGVYAPESFEKKQHYGITLFMAKDPEIKAYFDTVLPSLEEWLSRRELKGVSLIISSAITKENLEKWDFDVQNVNPHEGDVTITGGKREYGKKKLAEIQQGIRTVIRQVTATVTFLPLLETRCEFDLRIYLAKRAKVATGWVEEKDADIENPEKVELRSFSSSVHRVNASVTYKADVA